MLLYAHRLWLMAKSFYHKYHSILEFMKKVCRLKALKWAHTLQFTKNFTFLLEKGLLPLQMRIIGPRDGFSSPSWQNTKTKTILKTKHPDSTFKVISLLPPMALGLFLSQTFGKLVVERMDKWQMFSVSWLAHSPGSLPS